MSCLSYRQNRRYRCRKHTVLTVSSPCAESSFPCTFRNVPYRCSHYAQAQRCSDQSCIQRELRVYHISVDTTLSLEITVPQYITRVSNDFTIQKHKDPQTVVAPRRECKVYHISMDTAPFIENTVYCYSYERHKPLQKGGPVKEHKDTSPVGMFQCHQHLDSAHYICAIPSLTSDFRQVYGGGRSLKTFPP